MRQFWPFPRARSLDGERGKKRDSAVRIARFGVILKERDRSLRSGPVPSLPIRLSVSGRSHRGSVCARWSGRRRAWGGRIFSRGMLGEKFLGSQRVGRPVRIGARICCPDGGKTPRNGVEKATLGAICYVHITAQLLLKNTFMSKVAVHESPPGYRRNFRIPIALRRKHGAPNF